MFCSLRPMTIATLGDGWNVCPLEMKTRMPRQPALHFGMFMGGVVIADQVQLPVGGDGLVDEAEKLEPLLVPMALLAQAKDLAVGRIQRGKQCGRAVAFVVVRHGGAASALQRQAGLSTVESLNLALLVGAQHQGVLWRIEVQADDVFQLLRELGMVADLESFDAMRFQSVGAPDASASGSNRRINSGFGRILRRGAPTVVAHCSLHRRGPGSGNNSYRGSWIDPFGMRINSIQRYAPTHPLAQSKVGRRHSQHSAKGSCQVRRIGKPGAVSSYGYAGTSHQVAAGPLQTEP